MARRYTNEQREALRRLEEHHEAYVEAKAELRRKIEEEFAVRLAEFEREESRLMNVALRTVGPTGKGVAKTDIGRAVGLANWAVLEEKYDLTADEFEDFTPKKVDDAHFTYVVQPATPERPKRVHLTRFLSYRLDVFVTAASGALVTEGEIPFQMEHDIHGIEGALPEYDVAPDLVAASAWADFEAEARKVLGTA